MDSLEGVLRLAGWLLFQLLGWPLGLFRRWRELGWLIFR